MVAGDGSGSLTWKTMEKREIYDAHVFRVFEKTSRGPGGLEGRFAVIGARDWAVVVPVIGRGADMQFLMVRQFRHGSDQGSLEFPGGVVEDGEEPIRAAARELCEETGHTATTIFHAGSVFPNPAIQSNRFHVFVAVDPEPGLGQNLDEHEIVDAILMPAKAIMEDMGEGELSHALMATALFLAEKCLRKRGIALS